MTDILDDEELSPPGKPDFRRVGKGRTPFVMNPEGTRRIRYGRPSNAGKILDDESNLTDWKLRTVVVGAAQRPELMAQVSTLNPQQDKNELRDIVEECIKSGKGKERAVKGEAVHSMFDHLDRGDEWQPAPQWVDLCNSYLDMLVEWGLAVVDIEVHCINDEFHLAGSMDRRYRTTKTLVAPDGSVVPIGSVIAADTKTGATLEYAAGSYATQLAAYARSMKYNVETDEREDFNPPTFRDWGLVVHADSGQTKVEVYWVDLVAGLQGLNLVREVKAWRTRSDLLTFGPSPEPPVPPLNLPAEPAVDSLEPRRTLSLYDHTRARVRALLGHSELAGKQLQLLWPKDVPGLKVGGHTWEQLQQVIEVVQQVEANYTVPFFPPWDDPDKEEVMARHPSMTDNLERHPRKGLLAQWILKAKDGGIDQTKDPLLLMHSLMAFASINTEGWSNEPVRIEEQLSLFLAGTLRAMGYKRGLLDLGKVEPEHTNKILDAAESIAKGTAMLLYQEDGNCILRTNIVRTP